MTDVGQRILDFLNCDPPRPPSRPAWAIARGLGLTIQEVGPALAKLQREGRVIGVDQALRPRQRRIVYWGIPGSRWPPLA